MTDEEAEAFMAEMWRHAGGMPWRGPVRLSWFQIRETARDTIAEALRQGIVVLPKDKAMTLPELVADLEDAARDCRAIFRDGRSQTADLMERAARVLKAAWGFSCCASADNIGIRCGSRSDDHEWQKHDYVPYPQLAAAITRAMGEPDAG